MKVEIIEKNMAKNTNDIDFWSVPLCVQIQLNRFSTPDVASFIFKNNYPYGWILDNTGIVFHNID